jgi:hypothetical protein
LRNWAVSKPPSVQDRSRNSLTALISVASATIGGGGLWIAYEWILPQALKTKDMANGFAMLGIGFVAVCFSFASLLTEGRGKTRSVPVLALRVIVSLAFFAWVGVAVLNGAFMFPLLANLRLLAGSVLLAIAFLVTLVVGRQVEGVAEAEAERTGTIDAVRRSAADLAERISLNGPAWMGERVSRLVEDLAFLSPSDADEARELEKRMAAFLKDLAATIPARDSPTQAESETAHKLDELESAVRRRKKILSE